MSLIAGVVKMMIDCDVSNNANFHVLMGSIRQYFSLPICTDALPLSMPLAIPLLHLHQPPPHLLPPCYSGRVGRTDERRNALVSELLSFIAVRL